MMHIESSSLYRLLTNRWILVLFLVSCSYLTIDDGHNWGDDFALYVSQAISIVDGTTNALFETNKFAMDNSDRLTGPYLYPVGTALSLAPVIKLFGVNFYAMKMIMLLFWAASLYIIYTFFKLRTDSTKVAAFITICFGLHPQMVIQSDTIGSDIPFLFFTFLFFARLQKNSVQNPYLFYTQLVGIIFASYVFRSTGILFLPLLSFHQLQQWKTYPIRKNILLLAFPYVLFLLLSKGLSLLYKIDSGSYLQYLLLTDLPTILQNIWYYVELFAAYPFNLWELAIPFLPAFKGIQIISGFIYMISLLLFGISIYGIYSRFKENLDLILFTVIVMGVFIIWPSKQGYRFIIPLLPIYLHFLWLGCIQIKNIYNSIITRSLPLLLVSTIAVSGLICVIQFKFIKNTDAIHTTESKELYAFIKSHTDTTDILCFFKPLAHRLEKDLNAIRQYTDEKSLIHSKADYYISYRTPIIHYAVLQLVFKNTDFAVYRINRPDTL
ncbi:MAG: hypothetical protein ACTHJT_09055 [Cytophaga sp.]|uniref:hypothetical protein n=1 Tax=Cytophaga sp. TaxID=29535 RepID=UPI003F7E346E